MKNEASLRQGNQITNLLLSLGGKKQVQKLIQNWDLVMSMLEVENTDKIDRKWFTEFVKLSDNLTLEKTFTFTVPETYIHHKSLATFEKENPDSFAMEYKGNNITDASFIFSSEMKVGKNYSVEIFGFNTGIEAALCKTFSQMHKTLLLGVQGAVLAYKLAPEQFPTEKIFLSFDHRCGSQLYTQQGEGGIVLGDISSPMYGSHILCFHEITVESGK